MTPNIPSRRSPGDERLRQRLQQQADGCDAALLDHLYYVAEALAEGDAGLAHAIVLDAIDDLRGAV